MAKKWMAVIEEDQYKWLTKMIKETGTNGSLIIRTAIDTLRKTDAGDFKTTLLQGQYQSKIEALHAKRKSLELEEARLKQMIGERLSKTGES